MLGSLVEGKKNETDNFDDAKITIMDVNQKLVLEEVLDFSPHPNEKFVYYGLSHKIEKIVFLDDTCKAIIKGEEYVFRKGKYFETENEYFSTLTIPENPE